MITAKIHIDTKAAEAVMTFINACIIRGVLKDETARAVVAFYEEKVPDYIHISQEIVGISE